MKKLGCAKCGGSMKKMQKGGQMYGIPQTGPTGPNYQGIDTMKKGGIAKAKFGATVAVKASCKNGMVRGSDGKCVMERPRFKKGGTPFGMLSVKAGVDKNPKPTAADRIAGAKMKKGGMIKKYQDGGTTKTRTGRDGKTITKTTRSNSFDTEPKIGYSMKERSVSDKEGNLLKAKTKTTFTGTPAGTNRRTVVSKWNLKKDPESEGKSRKGIIPVRAKKK